MVGTCEHPLSDLVIAGESVNPLPTAFHTLLQTIADLMLLPPLGELRKLIVYLKEKQARFLYHYRQNSDKSLQVNTICEYKQLS